MTVNPFLRLNNLFNNDTAIEDVKKYLRKGVFPPGCNTTYKMRKFNEKYHNFVMKNDDIVYSPLNLVVVPKSEIENVMQKLYDNPVTGIGRGIVLFYKYICSKYINITRAEVNTFLKQQAYYQMTFRPNLVINKPIVATYPNELWCIDLIDVSRLSNIRDNKKHNFILTCIDAYSGYLWAIKLKRKEIELVMKGLQEIINKATVTPKHILADNGSEFGPQLKEYLAEQNITIRHTRVYSAQSNGLIENANGQLRKKLRELFTRNNNLIWINSLDMLCENKNNSWNATLKATPVQLWKSTNTPLPIRKRKLPESFNKTDLDHMVQTNRIQQAKKPIADFKAHEFQLGDIVRVKMASIYNNIKKAEKANEMKHVVITFTPDLYKIVKVVKTRMKGLSRDAYIVSNLDDEIIVVGSKNTHKRFYASDLLLSSLDSNAGFTNKQANKKLNRIKANTNDAYLN